MLSLNIYIQQRKFCFRYSIIFVVYLRFDDKNVVTELMFIVTKFFVVKNLIDNKIIIIKSSLEIYN